MKYTNPTLEDRAAATFGRATAGLFLFAVSLLLAPPAAATDLATLNNGFVIRHEHHLVMGAITRLYLTTDDSNFTDVATDEIASYERVLTPPEAPRTAPPPALPLKDVINTASATYHLDPDLVNSVIHAESGFNVHAVSPKGARGLMQLMPGTASQLGVQDAFDPQSNVAGGSRYLRELLERYNFDLVKALAAYNAGPQRVDQYHGMPPFRETRSYVKRIVHEYNQKKTAQEKAAKAGQVPAKPAAPAHHAAKPAANALAEAPPPASQPR